MELPHRHPIALIDEHTIINDEEIEATFLVKNDHPVLEGHFPHVKIWPGVYLIEGMNQCAGLHALYLAGKEVGTVKHEDYVTFVTSVDKCKFRFPVFPGTKLTLQAKLVRRKFNHMFYECKVFDNETRVASANVGLTAKKL
jgi:3-hydroxyacyl-[acyl-carrier-protein] dehydratase|tara:strand:+ start:11388 stop:11810 length:423 start_codon:yes stop_codon:yes gene_type:complete